MPLCSVMSFVDFIEKYKRIYSVKMEQLWLLHSAYIYIQYILHIYVATANSWFFIFYIASYNHCVTVYLKYDKLINLCNKLKDNFIVISFIKMDKVNSSWKNIYFSFLLIN